MSDADRAALLQLHELERRAHLEGDAALLAEVFADDVWEAGRGELSLLSRADLERRFAAYFEQVRYSVWDDLAPPHVAIAGDGSLAWMAVQVEARLRPAAGTEADEREFQSAWIATYRRREGRWQMVGISSSVVDRS